MITAVLGLAGMSAGYEAGPRRESARGPMYDEVMAVAGEESGMAETARRDGLPDSAYWQSVPVAVTGGTGFLGRHVVASLEDLGADVRSFGRSAHDLRDREQAHEALAGAEVVLHLAANVGGIGYINENPVPVAADNLTMGINVFEACREHAVRKLVVAGSACVYPKDPPVPFREETIWSGHPEPATAPYGLAKRTLLGLSEAYRRQHGLNSNFPVFTNLYGPNDSYDLDNSHVVAALVRKFTEAAERGDRDVVLWGTGRATREALYVEDAVRALLLAAENLDSSEPFNVGTGHETPIAELAQMISGITGFSGEIVWDATRPDGVLRRCFDVSRARELIGFEAEVSLDEGLRRTVDSYRAARSPVA
jgi:GDP-L-fucose synthase